MPPNSAESPPPPRWPLYLLAVIAAAGMLLRLTSLRESLWLDELHTAWCASGSLSEVSARATIGNQSPVFFWLEWLLAQIFGPSELALRLPSLLAGVLLPLALYRVARGWTRSALVALVAAALAAVDPRSIFYATEARPYALVELLAVVHVALFVKMIANPTPRRRAAVILLAGLMFHLHYTAALLFPAEVLFWIFVRRIDSDCARYRASQLALDLFFFAAIVAPAMGNVQAIAARRANWAEFVHLQPVTAILRIYFWGAAIVFVLVDPDAFLRSSWPPGRRGAPNEPLRRELPLVAVLCWLMVPLGIAWLLTASDTARLFFARYLVVSAPAAILLAAFCARLPRWPTARIGLGLAIVAVAIVTSGIVPRVRQDGRAIASRSEDWRGAIRWLDARYLDQPATILLASGLIEADELRQPHGESLDDYCLFPLLTSVYPLHVERDELIPLAYHRPGQLDASVAQRVFAERSVWIVIRGRSAGAKQVVNDVAISLRSLPKGTSRAWRVAEQRSFGRVHVVRIEQLR